MKIIVVGTGFVGLPHAAVLSEYGHEVYAYDIDSERIQAYQSGDRDRIESYVNEPGLMEAIEETIDRYLFFTTNLEAIVDESGLQKEIEQQAEIEIKYQGYFNRQKAMIKKMENLEQILIPEGFDYGQVPALSTEAREKLINFLPRSLGQASRIDGVRASDVSILMVFIEKARRKNLEQQ